MSQILNIQLSIIKPNIRKWKDFAIEGPPPKSKDQTRT